MPINISQNKKIEYCKQVVLKYGLDNAYQQCKNKYIIDSMIKGNNTINNVLKICCNINETHESLITNNLDRTLTAIQKYSKISELFRYGINTYENKKILDVIAEIKKQDMNQGLDTFNNYLKENNIINFRNSPLSIYTLKGEFVLSKDKTSDLAMDTIINSIFFDILGINSKQILFKTSLGGLNITLNSFINKVLDNNAVLAILRGNGLNISIEDVLMLGYNPDHYIGYNIITIPTIETNKLMVYWLGDESEEIIILKRNILDNLIESGKLDSLHVKNGIMTLENKPLREYMAV